MASDSSPGASSSGAPEGTPPSELPVPQAAALTRAPRARGSASLRAGAPWRVLDGFGRAVQVASRYAAPSSVDELAHTLERARSEGLSVAFRGSGRSYGDAALNSSGLVVDLRGLNRVKAWLPEEGILEAEAGLTVEGVWRRIVEDGYWPHVVPGTMHPTLAGCVSMNIHGKNNFKAGTFGEHVLEFDLLTPRGELLTCSRTQHSDIFHAVIGGLGLLGAVTRVKLKAKRVHSGRLAVTPLSARSLEEMFAQFEDWLPVSDYLVGWVDCFARGSSLGRGEVHSARYLKAGEDPQAASSFHIENQGLPGSIFGVPKSSIWRFGRPVVNNFGIRLLNLAKYQMSRFGHLKGYLQSHVAFAFLLDYVPNWRLAYGPGGLIQYQAFVPYSGGLETLQETLRICQSAGLPSYLGVLKRHRPDPFLMTHALDGWSLAMDFRVTKGNRARLWQLTERLTEYLLARGGKFYFAKDAVLHAPDIHRAYGSARIEQFLALKERLDPDALLSSDLYTRLLKARSI